MATRPNVLLISTDQMRSDHLGCYGNPVIRTPHLDQLAAGGVRVDRAYVSNPLCMPNRATLVTGRLPRNHRVWCNGIDLPENETTLADHLARAGYHTALLGKAHFSCFGGGQLLPGPQRENIAAWTQGVVTADWHGPYYGFQEVALHLGHGAWGAGVGHYGAWLRARHPDHVAAAQGAGLIRSPSGAPQCYTPNLPPEAYYTTWTGDQGVRYARQRAADRQPFFCWLSFADPHHPFSPPRPYDTMYDPATVPMPRLGAAALADKPPHFRRAYTTQEAWEGIGAGDDLDAITEPQMRDIIARTYGMITLIDENVGRVLAELERSGLADNTIVLFTSDHGDLMGDCGLLFKGPFLLEGLINVPLIWRVPGRGAQGVHSAGLFNSCDLAPTLLALLGLGVPPAMDGIAQPELACGGAAHRDAAFVEFKSKYRPELNLRTVITADRKLTYYPGLSDGELYDMTQPVPEQRNLYHDPAHAGERTALLQRLLDWEIRSADNSSQPISHA